MQDRIHPLNDITTSRCRWRFDNAVFDEAAWTLTVDGTGVQIETKPLAILCALLRHPGDVCSKDMLIDSAWPNVVVSDASLATAISKLRRALGDDNAEAPIIQTVAKIGYRLAVPVAVEPVSLSKGPFSEPAKAAMAADDRRLSPWKWWAMVIATGVIIGVAVYGLRPTPKPWNGIAAAGAPQAVAVPAIRALDGERLNGLLRAGWDPDIPFDREGNAALHVVLEICEWNPNHNREKLMVATRLLLDGGAALDQRNIWGDTPLSIASAPRYCGPDHPVTRMIRRYCYEGPDAPGDRCLAAPRASQRTPDKPGTR